MNEQALVETANKMVANGKGLLAIDESTGTCNQRFAQYGIAQTAETRRSFRDLIVTTPGIAESISGMILFDETIRQETNAGISFADALLKSGIIPGIKVDVGAKPMAAFTGEKITEGLDGLRERLYNYFAMGARFAKWRAVLTIGDGRPSSACIQANAHALARYAALCQEAGLVPVVEPEVLMEGTHSLQQCQYVTEKLLRCVFKELASQRILLEGLILKPNMVLAGSACPMQDSTDDVANATIKCLRRTVPAAVAGIAFLSGGQSGELASERLNAMNLNFTGRLPWPVAFSFGRAIQQPALEIWGGLPTNITSAQRALYHRAMCNRAARLGEYTAQVEHDVALATPPAINAPAHLLVA